MPRWDRPGVKTVNVEITETEYEAMALIAREGRLPIDEVIKRLMRAGLEAMAVRTGMTAETLAASARRKR